MKQHIGKLFAALGLTVTLLLSSCDADMYVVGAQPVAPVYARPAAPGAGYLWVEGDWVWSGGSYAWHNGYWAAPRGRRVWEAGRWEQRRGGYTWRRGHWR